jgi:EAL domain-containing protein (putative c-di-GMP-specific phosphodiesterase class I)
MKVAVNLSPVQFVGGEVARVVRAALDAAGLAPERLELEITESVLLQRNDAVLACLRELRAMGVRMALDDFGTGYASLGYLRTFPFDKIKIDQSFVRDAVARPDCLAIVRSVAGLAAELGMVATAEGVEGPEHLAMVRGAGCAEAQGYHLGRPLPLAEAGALLGR